MIVKEQINNSNLLYDKNQNSYPEDYFFYCLDLIKEKIKNTDKAANILVGKIGDPISNNKKNIKIDLQVEHTLVLKNATIGRVSDCSQGNIKTNSGDYYNVNIHENQYKHVDIIIEYSQPNITNICSCSRYNNLSKKIIYIAPTIYDYNAANINKSQTIVFHNWTPRRNFILNNAKNFDYKVCYAYTKENILHLYDNSKIIVNIHQTDFHHTFEEFRALAALLRGVIVVSEKVPLVEKIPYNQFIVWAEYENLIETTKHIQENYDYYFNKIFGNNSLKLLIERLKSDNVNNLEYLVSLME